MKRRNIFLLLFLFVFLSGVFFFGTKLGLVVIQKGLNTFSGGNLTIGSVEGSLATRYTLRNIHLDTAVAGVDIDSFQWAWQPLSLLKGTLDVTSCATTSLSVQIKANELGAAEKKADEFNLPVFFPVDRLRIQNFSIDDINVTAADGVTVLQLSAFTTSVDVENDLIVVHDFNADGPEIGLAFHGSIALKKDQNLDLAGTWHLTGFGFHPSKGTFSMKGPRDTIGVNVSLTEPGEIKVTGLIKDIFGTASWTADVDARNINLEKWILYCPEIILSKVHGDMSGDFGHYRGLVVADGFWGVADKLHLRSDIDGDGLGIDFSSLRIDRNESSAVASNASISWAKLFSWQADLDFTDFAISMFFPDFKGSVSSRFHSVGDVTEQGLVASFNLEKMNGRVAEYAWSATGNIGLTEERIFSQDLQIKSSSVGGLAIIHEVELSWVDKLSWKADVDLDHFDPGFLHPMAAGDISGSIRNTLEWNDDLLAGKIGISQLSGEVRGIDVKGGGDLVINGKAFSSNGFSLSLGGSQFEVSGALGETLGLKFAFDSPNLAEIDPNFLGNISIHGNIFGIKDIPEIELNISGNNFHAGDIDIHSFQGSLQAAISGAIDGAVELEDGVVGGVTLEKATVSVTGTTIDHNITGELSGPDGKLDFTLFGKYEKDWLAQLEQFTLMSKVYGNWTQLDSAAVGVSTEHGWVDDFCIENVASNEGNRTCISVKFATDDTITWSLDADMSDFDLAFLEKMSLTLPPVNGRLDAHLQADGDKLGVTLASGYVTIPKVEALLNVTDSDFVSVRLSDAVLKAHLEDQKLALDMFFKANKGGSVNLAGQIQGIGQFDTPLKNGSLDGELTLDKYYLSSLAAFTGYGVEPTGWISSTFQLGGTVGQPELYGELAIQEGGLELAYQGITLDNVVLSIDSRESGAIVHGGASSDGGRLEVGGFIAYGQDGPEATLKLTGENFLLVNLPEYSFRVTPNAEMKVNKNRGQIKGQVIVPSGLIAPEELSGVVKVSEDVVFLGKEQVHTKTGYPFFLDLDVKLGDEVKVDGYGLKGRLGGNLNVKITPDEFITGRGELDLFKSTFSFYGRSLDIARGRILFTGGPIDNPGVDIRAQKVINAKTARDDEYTVGVDINGLVQDLKFQLFSDPFMEDTDILSQMVVGHSFAGSSEEESSLLQAAATTLGLAGSGKLMHGIGSLLFIDDLHLEGSTKKEDVSLVVGKRITEDLYIGYDMNMFSRLGQFRVRYDLSRGFYVETRSSSESTGADFIYTFKR